MTAQIPATVQKRKRLIFATDAFISLVIICAPLQFTLPGLSNVLWLFAGLGAALSHRALQASIRGAHRPNAQLDEYELQQHVEARDDGLKTALLLSIVLWIVSGAILLACATVFHPTPVDVTLFFSKLIFLQLMWAPFAVTRSLAGKLNRDELISGDD